MLVETVDPTKPQKDVTSVVKSNVKARESRGTAGQSQRKEQNVDCLRDMLEVAQNHFHVSNVGLDFSVHEATGRIKITVTDKDTGKLIREIPPGQVLNLMAKLEEMMGILYDEKV